MSKQSFIRPFLAAALLVLFTISSTPRSWLHDLFAKHKDSYGFVASGAKTAVSAQHINCQCDSMVVHEPYILEEPATVQGLISFFTPPHFFYKEYPLPACLLFTELRGPPSLA